MKKKIFAALLALGLIAALLPAGALAAPPWGTLQLGGTQLVSGGVVTGATVTGATYDEASNTLTLNGYNGGIIQATNMEGLKLVLVGWNSAGGSLYVAEHALIVRDTKLTISGSGNLMAAGSRGSSSGGGAGMFCEGGSVTITGGTVMAVGDNHFGVQMFNSDLTIAGGNLAASTQNNAHPGIYVLGGSFLVSSGTVRATGDIGISAGAGGNSFTISGGSLEAIGQAYALDAQPSFGTPNTWYRWKENTQPVEPAGDYTISSATVQFVYTPTVRYLKVVPAVRPAANIPETGDSAMPMLWLCLALGAAMCLGLRRVAVRKRG